PIFCIAIRLRRSGGISNRSAAFSMASFSVAAFTVPRYSARLRMISTRQRGILRHNPFGQALAWRLLVPVGAQVDLVSPAAVFGADDTAFEVWDLRFGRVAPDFYQRGMSAGVIQA